MSEKIRKYIFNCQYTVYFIIGTIAFPQHWIPFLICAVLSLGFNLFDLFMNKPYVPVGDFHKENTDEENEKEDIINKFINEICGYASDRKIRPMLANNGSEGMILQDMPEDDSEAKKVCLLTIPAENVKYGSDEYKAAVNLITEKIDDYVNARGNK